MGLEHELAAALRPRRRSRADRPAGARRRAPPRAYAAPMNANCTRISGRTSAFAPTSSSVTGRPGTGSVSASAGRWTPGARRMCSCPATSAAPVEPLQTSACARPSATARAACTIDASGVAAHGAHRVGVLRDRERGVDDLDAVAGPAEVRRGAEQQHAHALRGGEARGGGNLSRSEIGAVGVDRDDRHLSVVVIVVVLARSDDLATRVRAAHRAHAMRPAGALAARARVDRGRSHLVLRAALGGAAVRLLLLWEPASAREA